MSQQLMQDMGLFTGHFGACFESVFSICFSKWGARSWTFFVAKSNMLFLNNAKYLMPVKANKRWISVYMAQRILSHGGLLL